MGASLPLPLRSSMETAFGRDFSRVRIHADAAAHESAAAVNASAFTVGRDIVFGVGAYDPVSAAGRRTIAHELVHVLQQPSSDGDPQRLGSHQDAAEQEAERLSAVAIAHGNGRSTGAAPIRTVEAPGRSLSRISFGTDGTLSPARQTIVSRAAGIAAALVASPKFEAQWNAWWKALKGAIRPQPTLAAYRAAVTGRVIHDWDTTKNSAVRAMMESEGPMPLERQTAGVTIIGTANTYLREFAIDQGVDSVVDLILHESMHGAGVPMGPMRYFELYINQFLAQIKFPMMMGGGDIIEITQKRRGDYDVDISIRYRLRVVDPTEGALPGSPQISVVDPETGEVIEDELASGARRPAQAPVGTPPTSGVWVWHARHPGFGTYTVRLSAGGSLLASKEFQTDPRCVLGVSTVHCPDEAPASGAATRPAAPVRKGSGERPAPSGKPGP